MQAIEGIELIKQGNGNWRLALSKNLTYEEFRACMKKFLSSPTAPHTVLIKGETWTYSDLCNAQAIALLYQRLTT